jgi:hypothetical protein
MRMVPRHLTLAAGAAAAVLAACHRAPASVTPVRDLVGSYTFEEQLPGRTPVAGELQILPDSFAVESRLGVCRRPMYALPKAPPTVEFQCPDFTVDINSQDPLGKTTYLASITEIVHRTECLRYGSDKDGKQICLETGDKIEEKTVGRSGRLHLHPVQR